MVSGYKGKQPYKNFVNTTWKGKKMKKILEDKRVISALIIITIALMITMIVVSIKNSHNKKSKSVQTISYQTMSDSNTENELDDSNELIDISDFDNEVNIDDEEQIENSDDKNAQNDKNKQNENKNESGPKYYIKINNRQNRVNVYEKDDDGNYTKLVRGMICSTGECTPPCSLYKKKVYKMLGNRCAWAKFHTVFVRYPTRIVGGIFFHSVPYLTQSKDGLSYSMFDKLGQSVSAGCIRLQLADAKWIYDNVQAGTIVEFDTNVSNGARAPKITGYEKCRNWDPTDTDPSNPWKNPALAVQTKANSNTDTNSNNETKPANEVKPSNEAKPANEVKPSNETKPANEIKSSNKTNPVNEAKSSKDNKTSSVIKQESKSDIKTKLNNETTGDKDTNSEKN